MKNLARSAYQKMLDLRENEALSVAQFAEKQLVAFRDFASFAYHNSAFYRRIIDEHNIALESCLPQDFPVLTKQNFLENFDEIVTDPTLNLDKVAAFAHGSSETTELLDDKYVVVCTSGSSGLYGYFVYTLEEALLNSMQASRFFTGSAKKTVFVGVSSGHRASPTVANLRQMARLPSLGGKAVLIDCHMPLAEMVAQLNQAEPDLLVGYTQIILSLAREKLRGALRVAPQNLQVSGERLTAEERKLLEQAFGCNVTNVYASSECLYMGFQRSDMAAMALLEDDIVFELGDGFTCITSLFNRTVPLIRYRIEDQLLASGEADYSYPFKHVQGVIGRSDEGLELRNSAGDMVSLHPFLFSSSCSEHLRQMQIREISDNELAVLAAVTGGLTGEELREVEGAICGLLERELLNMGVEDVVIDIQFCQRIPPDPVTGKHKVVIKRDQYSGQLER